MAVAAKPLAAEVLGRLLVLQQVMLSLPTVQGIAAFFARSLSELPGVKAAAACISGRMEPADIFNPCRHCGKGSCDYSDGSGMAVFPIQGSTQITACLLVKLSDSMAFTPYRPFISNIAYLVATELDRRDYHSRLEQTEKELARVNHFLEEAQRIAHLGSWELESADNRLNWSDEIFRIFELDPARFESSYEAFLSAIHPDDRGLVDQAYRRSVESGDLYEIVHRLRMKDGRIKYVQERGQTAYEDGRPLRSMGTVQDITTRHLAELALKKISARLKASNQDLQQFAYVISHDLQEPLRMVSSYLQLLERRYRGEMDQDADEFIHFAVDGAQRMSAMIDGLLQYSRVESQAQPFVETDLETALEGALANLQLAIEESGAEVIHGPLPKVDGDAGQMQRLFQNLIGNAVKFRGKQSPQVRVEAVRQENVWVISVADNGIGISPEQVERIFVIFQRLHTRDDYPGMGIGLAVCKKIVESHGGRIWVESKEGEGSLFFFTLPASE